MPISFLASTPIIVDRPKERASSILAWRRVAVVLGIIALSFPTLALPLFPSLDSSWMIGLHEAAEDEDWSSAVMWVSLTAPLVISFSRSMRVLRPPLRACCCLALYATWWTSVALIVSRLKGYITIVTIHGRHSRFRDCRPARTPLHSERHPAGDIGISRLRSSEPTVLVGHAGCNPDGHWSPQ